MTAKRQRASLTTKSALAGRPESSASGGPRVVRRAASDHSSDAAPAGPWPRRAAVLAGLLPAGRFHAGALAEIRRAAAAGGPVAIACSGGADSVALVTALWVHVPEMRGRWLILHFDHALRGRASAADARFVASLARGLGERCLVERWRRPGSRAHSGAETGVSEAQARAARFCFFGRAMAAAGARALVLGHQAEDVVETMLMRLARGSGAGGLAAPRAVHRHADGTVRLRPLLTLASAEIRTALRSAGMPWREDASNHGDAFLRNRIRQRVVPALREAAGSGFLGGFLASRQMVEDDDAALGAWLQELAGAAGNRRWTDLAGRPRALARRAVHAWLQAAGVSESLNRAAAEDVVTAVATGRAIRASAGSGRFIMFDGKDLHLDAAPPTAARAAGWGKGAMVVVGASLAGPDGALLRAERVELTERLRREIRAGRFSPAHTVFFATESLDFQVRQRRAGDAYRPLGAPGRASLQDLLVNRKIPRAARDRLPVVCDAAGQPLWVPGLPPADEMAVQRGTKLVVQLTYIPPGAIVPIP